MGMIPTKELVWQLSCGHSEFLRQMPEGSPYREALRPFLEASVDVLEDMFNMPACVQTVAEAKLRYMRHCIDNGYTKVVVKILSSIIGSADESRVTDMYARVIGELKLVVYDAKASLNERGVTEETIMTSAWIGLNAENQEAWRNGTLTIGDILASQPEVILHNNPC